MSRLNPPVVKRIIWGTYRAPIQLSFSASPQPQQQVFSSIENDDVDMDNEAPNDPIAAIRHRRPSEAAPKENRKVTKGSDKITDRKPKQGAPRTT
jgi:hypothetical protein